MRGRIVIRKDSLPWVSDSFHNWTAQKSSQQTAIFVDLSCLINEPWLTNTYRVINGRMRLVRQYLPGPSHSGMIDLRLEKSIEYSIAHDSVLNRLRLRVIPIGLVT